MNMGDHGTRLLARIRDLIRASWLGTCLCLAVVVLYAACIKHPVRCLWCNQPAEYKTCIELFFGHTDIVHIVNAKGRRCFSEFSRAIRMLNDTPDSDASSMEDFKRTYLYGAEHQSKERIE
jgi:hypothetical protein